MILIKNILFLKVICWYIKVDKSKETTSTQTKRDSQQRRWAVCISPMISFYNHAECGGLIGAYVPVV
jgi:hypothetical protein